MNLIRESIKIAENVQILNPTTSTKKKIILEKGNSICNEKYVISHKIGQGTFGQVYIGIQNKENKNSNEIEFAIKVESEVNNKNPQLLNQSQFLKKFNDNNQNQGFPKFYAFGTEGHCAYLVMELLGPNLQDLMNVCGGIFSLKTVILIGIQIFERLEIIHDKGYAYRDIKPQNFMMGLDKNSNKLYIVDFGLCKRYKDQKTQLHFPYRQDRPLIGTIRYSSVNAHLGIQQSRRDDLQAVCYMLIYFLKGKLPWQGYKSDARMEKQHIIMESKLKMTVKELCQDLPFEFENITKYCRQLGYQENPQYRYLINELSTLYARLNFLMDYAYDWTMGNTRRYLRTSHIDLELTNKLSKKIKNNQMFQQNESQDDDQQENYESSQDLIVE